MMAGAAGAVAVSESFGISRIVARYQVETAGPLSLISDYANRVASAPKKNTGYTEGTAEHPDNETMQSFLADFPATHPPRNDLVSQRATPVRYTPSYPSFVGAPTDYSLLRRSLGVFPLDQETGARVGWDFAAALLGMAVAGPLSYSLSLEQFKRPKKKKGNTRRSTPPMTYRLKRF